MDSKHQKSNEKPIQTKDLMQNVQKMDSLLHSNCQIHTMLMESIQCLQSNDPMPLPGYVGHTTSSLTIFHWLESITKVKTLKHWFSLLI